MRSRDFEENPHGILGCSGRTKEKSQNNGSSFIWKIKGQIIWAEIVSKNIEGLCGLIGKEMRNGRVKCGVKTSWWGRANTSESPSWLSGCFPTFTSERYRVRIPNLGGKGCLHQLKSGAWSTPPPFPFASLHLFSSLLLYLYSVCYFPLYIYKSLVLCKPANVSLLFFLSSLFSIEELQSAPVVMTFVTVLARTPRPCYYCFPIWQSQLFLFNKSSSICTTLLETVLCKQRAYLPYWVLK